MTYITLKRQYISTRVNKALATCKPNNNKEKTIGHYLPFTHGEPVYSK